MFKKDNANNGTFFLKSVTKYYSVKISDIKWIYVKGNHCIFYLEDNKEYTVRTSLKTIIDFLNAEELVQIHRNYLINYTKIEMYDPSGTVVIDNQELPLSNKFKKDLESNLNLF